MNVFNVSFIFVICYQPQHQERGYFSTFFQSWYAVAEWYGAGLCDCEVADSTPAHGCCVPMPTQRAIRAGSVNEYQRKLGSKRAYHAMH